MVTSIFIQSDLSGLYLLNIVYQHVNMKIIVTRSSYNLFVSLTEKSCEFFSEQINIFQSFF